MNLNFYVKKLSESKKHKKVEESHYLANFCENKICCSENPDPVSQRLIDLTGQYEFIQICENCEKDISEGNFLKKITKEGLK